MKLSTNVIGQALMTALQMGNVLTSFVPASGKFYLAAGLGVIQIVLSVLAHISNPDGTPATMPYGLDSNDLAQYQRIFGGVAKIIILVAFALALAPHAIAQQACPQGFTCTLAGISKDLPVAAPATPYTPSVLVTGGGGFASPNGKFAYESVSKLIGPQSTYLTEAQEFTIVKGQVESCTFAGASKSLYQWSFLTIGLTGLAGGCNSTSGSSAMAGSGQGFALVRFGKSPWGVVFSAMKNTTGGFKVTAGMSWGM